MTTDELIEKIREESSYIIVEEKGDQGICAIVQLAFTFMIITDCDEYGYGNRWCYSSFEKALKAFDEWDGKDGTEPTGWHRHPTSGRRIDPDTGEQYINF